MTETLRKNIALMHENNLQQDIWELLSALPQEEQDFEVKSLMARALNNLDREAEALKILLSVKDEGDNDALWNFRIGYSYYYLDREEEALPHLVRAAELGDDHPDTLYLINSCKEILSGVVGPSGEVTPEQ